MTYRTTYFLCSYSLFAKAHCKLHLLRFVADLFYKKSAKNRTHMQKSSNFDLSRCCVGLQQLYDNKSMHAQQVDV